jgi:hypothetical protein
VTLLANFSGIHTRGEHRFAGYMFADAAHLGLIDQEFLSDCDLTHAQCMQIFAT